MVNLYKDPDGKNIVLTTTTDKRESTGLGTANGMEMKKLQMRISELEKSLQQRVSSLSLSLSLSHTHTHNTPGWNFCVVVGVDVLHLFYADICCDFYHQPWFVSAQWRFELSWKNPAFKYKQYNKIRSWIKKLNNYTWDTLVYTSAFMHAYTKLANSIPLYVCTLTFIQASVLLPLRHRIIKKAYFRTH